MMDALHAPFDGRAMNGRHPHSIDALHRARRIPALKISEHAHPLVRQLLVLMNAEGVTMVDVARRAGLSRHTLRNWRYVTNPSIAVFEAALNALGYEMRIVRKREE